MSLIGFRTGGAGAANESLFRRRLRGMRKASRTAEAQAAMINKPSKRGPAIRRIRIAEAAMTTARIAKASQMTNTPLAVAVTDSGLRVVTIVWDGSPMNSPNAPIGFAILSSGDFLP